MGCISLLSLIRHRQGNEILLLLKHYDLWIGGTAPVACTLSMSTHICVCPCVERKCVHVYVQVLYACVCANHRASIKVEVCTLVRHHKSINQSNFV